MDDQGSLRERWVSVHCVHPRHKEARHLLRMLKYGETKLNRRALPRKWAEWAEEMLQHAAHTVRRLPALDEMAEAACLAQ